MTSKKKILHLITGLEVGGAEMMLLKTLPRLQEDFDNRVCCIRGRGPIGKQLEEKGVPVYYLDLASATDIFTIIFRFRKVVTEFHPDLLITYLIHADLFGRILGRLFGIRKVICSQRGSLLQWEFLRTVDRLTKRWVDKYIVQTPAAKKELMEKLRLPEEKFEIIPNSLDFDEYTFPLDIKAKKRELGIPAKNINIVCVSNLRRGKGHEYLLEAFEQLFQNHKNISLLIVGDGEKKEELRSQVTRYTSKNNIYFLGRRNDVKEILHISDIFVLPTLAEGMSNAIMEAMASGLPVITTDIPENRKLVQNNSSGILVPPENSKVLADAIKLIINDQLLRESLGEKARKTAEEKFDINSILGKIKTLYISQLSETK
jgi:glycosyltransferase involved in cell wall biosynthesis